MTALFLAAKCENSTITLKDYLGKIPNAPEKDKMQEFEFKFSEGISFDYFVHSPYSAVHGFFLDMQAWLSSDFNKDVKMQKDLISVLSIATEKVTNLLLTDLILLYTPSQLGLACFVDASKEVGLGDLTDGYITHCWKSETVESMVDLRAILLSISETLSKFSPPQAKDAKRVDLILKQCRNPAHDPESSLYKWISESQLKPLIKTEQSSVDPFNSSHSSAEDLPGAI
jgi:cyclin H